MNKQLEMNAILYDLPVSSLHLNVWKLMEKRISMAGHGTDDAGTRGSG